MGKEIEHKYLVKEESFKKMAFKKVMIAQGYLSRNIDRTVRVRIAGEMGFITIKGKTTGTSRAEYEYEIPKEDAEEMLEMCEGRVIRKIRYYVNHEGMTWEVDCFEGDLFPLVVAEIELPFEEADYSLPSFVGRNVTYDPRYYNSALADSKELPPFE